MTPISTFLEFVRRRRGLLQKQVAASLGVTAALVSDYETGRRLPSERIIKAYGAALSLSSEEMSDLAVVAKISQRERTVPVDVSHDEYRMIDEIWQSLGKLSPEQVNAIREIVKFQSAQQPTRVRSSFLRTGEPKM